MVSRSGFSLVEAIVALAVFQLMLLGVVSGSLYALRQMRTAELRQSALLSLSVVVDSLLSLDSVVAGQRTSSGIEVRWSNRLNELEISATYPGIRAQDTLKVRLSAW
jgi:Tfp pilus assembly protein PilV